MKADNKSFSILWKGIKGAASDGTASMSSNTSTPLSLAEDFETTVVMEARVTQDDYTSAMDGIDVVSSAPAPETLCQSSSLWSGRILRSHHFRRAAMLSILMNSMIMGVATFDMIQEHDNLVAVFAALIRAFRIIFTIEILLTMSHYQMASFYGGWIVLDVIVIGLSWTSSISIMILRSFRLIGSLRKSSRATELNHLVEALLLMMPKMTAAIFLFCLVFYVFAVLFTDLYQDLYATHLVSYDYFGRVDRSAFTLLQIMTLDGWSDIAKDVMDAAPWSGVLLSLFIVLTTVIFCSLVIAIMSDALTNLTNKRILNAPQVNDSNAAQIEQLARLELTVEKLHNTVEHLVLAQHSIQESLVRIIPDNKKTDKEDSD